MACDGDKQPLLSGLADPAPQKNGAFAPYKRRFRCVKSAPLVDYVHPDTSNGSSVPRSGSIFGNLHSSIRKVAAFLGIYLGVGTACFYLVRDDISGKKTNNIVDSLYFCIVTMTTVGYGDLVPEASLAKILVCIFVFAGMALFGLIMNKVADYLVEKQEILLIKAMDLHHKVGPSETLKKTESSIVEYKFYVAIAVLVVHMTVGISFLIVIEDLDFIDALYCVCSTLATLGFGDKSFSTRGGRLFAIFWILAGTVGLGQFFLYVTELLTEKRQKALVNWVLTKRMNSLDLESADNDNDRVVGAAEFILYKLKEMGKITQEDISLVMEEFEDLDKDQSGTLSASDLMLAQNTETKK